jgi:hypothetical protein
MISQPWFDFFNKLLLRAGGFDAPTNEELYTVDTARIDDGSVTEAKLSASVAGAGLVGGAGSPLAVNPDGSTLEIASDAVRVKDSGVPFVKLLSSDWTNSIASSGYQKLPSGLILQWGSTGKIMTGTTSTITLPLPFPTICLQAIPGIKNNSVAATTTTGQFGTGNYSATKFDLYNRTSIDQFFNWFAMGN